MSALPRLVSFCKDVVDLLEHHNVRAEYMGDATIFCEGKEFSATRSFLANEYPYQLSTIILRSVRE